MTEIGTVIDGKYELLKEIGRGGMSVVYLAMDKHLNKQWAVKEIRKKGSGKNDEIVVNSLLAEANLMKRLDHPALPRIVDIIDNGVTIYVIMDYIEGESLDKILNRYGPQPEDEVINWAKQVCDALSYLHGQNPPIIYRDMKPANLMLKPEGNIKIIDFGIAREYKEQKLSDTTVLGTRGYAPPEQYSGQTDARSDIFALGMTMHHLLSGVDPRKCEAYAPVRMYNPALSEGIELIIDKCVQPAAENRYQNCDDLLYDLEHPELITRGYKKKQKRKLGLFITAAALSLAMLLSGFGCGLGAKTLNNNEYEVLVSSTNQSLDDIEKAISIYPERPDAYFRMLEIFEDQGFGDAELARFLSCYNRNKAALSAQPQMLAELNYKCGMMCFNLYGSRQDTGFSVRLNKAVPFFEENHNMSGVDFKDKVLSESYYYICRFYKEYVLDSSSVQEAGVSDYQQFFETITETMDSISDASPYDKLSFCNCVFTIVHEQRAYMAGVGVDKALVLDIFDRSYDEAEKLAVHKEVSKKLQGEILDSYDKFRQDIVDSYDNAAERRK